MKLYYQEKDYTLYNGNMLDMLEVIKSNSIDSIVCDPPYELNFMNKGWDNSGIAFQKEAWEKCYKALKPGGYLLAFGGSRTFHRIACAIEDAGFEIRDTIMWLYGSGFPKSMNIGLAIDKKNGVESIDTGITSPNARPNCDKSNTLYESGTVGKEFTIKKAQNEWKGWGTSLKPSYEPIIVARKPIENSVVENVLKYGVGGINIDECRVSTNEKIETGRNGRTTKSMFSKSELKNCEREYQENGRFPANTILTYDETDENEVCGGMPNSISHFSEPNNEKSNYESRADFLSGKAHKSGMHYEDEGSASRYFYCAKASKKDRDDGMIEFEEKTAGQRTNRKDGSAGINAYAGATGMAKNIHPTVKPIELMQYLVRLVSPKGATILDCFMGSGSTGKAVMFENRERNANYKFIGIELTEEYLPICKARIDYGKYKYEYDIKQEQMEDMQELGYSQTSIFDL